VKTVNQNILDVYNSIIFQVVNCKGVQGAGLARQIRNEWPEVYSSYIDKIKGLERYYMKQYNTFDSSFCLGEVNWIRVTDDNIIVNLFAQDDYGTEKRQLCYKSLINSLLNFKTQREEIGGEFLNKNLCFPWQIGCGLAGGNFSVVEKIINGIFPEAIFYKL